MPFWFSVLTLRLRWCVCWLNARHADGEGRIWNKAKTLGWNFTRSLGDVQGKLSGLLSTPDVKVTKYLLAQLSE